MIVGQEKPDAGTLRVGDTVAARLRRPEPRDARTASARVWEEISDGGRTRSWSGKREVNSRAYAAVVQLQGPDQQKKVQDLSGGERNRVHLAKLLRSGGNLLLLDEPTNDLDVDTLRALEDALLDFAGCAVVISHDRWFLDRIATHILAFEGDSRVVWFEGNYQDYEADRRRRLGAEADQPHRIKYRKLGGLNGPQLFPSHCWMRSMKAPGYSGSTLVASSRRARTFSGIDTPRAPRLSPSCASLRTPMITDVTSGLVELPRQRELRRRTRRRRGPRPPARRRSGTPAR